MQIAREPSVPAMISPDMLAEPQPLTITSDMTDGGTGEPEIADGRLDFEKDMSLSPALTISLMLANVAVFALLIFTGALADEQAIIRAGALSRPHVLGSYPATSPELWRLISSIFLHGGFDHLFGNCVALYILGMACEHAYGRGRFLLLYGLAGLGASVLSLCLNPGPSVGASGAIFGLMGAAIVFFRRHGKHFYVRDNRIGIVLIVWALYSIVTALGVPYIDNGAHVGGLLTGALVAMFVRPGILDRAGISSESDEPLVPRAFGS
jgi:rhomboid protease GluP